MSFCTSKITAMLPTFFLAGVPKAGTSSFHFYLNQHPQVFMSKPKEPHHFSWEDDGWPRWAVKQRAAYEALFNDARPDQERGDSSTWTLYSKGAPGRIAEAIPDARFIVLLRDPKKRAYSNWMFNVSCGFESLKTFEDALAAEPERITQGSPWHHHYVRAGLYAPQVRRYLEQFGPDRVLVHLFEDLKDDTVAVVQKTFGFLGVDPTFRPDVGEVRNRTTMPRSRWINTFMTRRGPLKRSLKRVIPFGLAARLGQRVRIRNQGALPAPSSDTSRRLNDLFREDVSELSDLLGRDLSSRWLK